MFIGGGKGTARGNLSPFVFRSLLITLEQCRLTDHVLITSTLTALGRTWLYFSTPEGTSPFASL
ncbi:MAG: hypothetical protein CL912_14710 [Deltaproteobacteria bacterium]|nr:hypothetical protein [Deltaproteobacteria bacterium]